ncbi:MAG: hypothetical protein II900_07380 [Prevotella sp.]|nr:hypothetical protein [Prevotella sp.]
MRYKSFIISTFFLFFCLAVEAKDANPKSGTMTATELFNKVYNLVFGPQGSALSYKVNIIGLYKTEGNIVYKGKKLHYSEARYMAWEDGITAYMVDKKKQQVNIYRFDDDNKDKYLSKFKYDVKNFDYSYVTEGDFYLVTAKVKNPSLFGIRSVKVRKDNLYPVSLTIKLALLRTTVQISNFRSGKIADSNFVFPKEKFKGYQFIDHRNEK